MTLLALAFGSVLAAPAPVADLKQALTTAVRDEYHAAAYCAAVLTKFPQNPAFTAVVQSERTHVQMVVRLLKKHKIEVPANTFARRKGESVDAFTRRLGVPAKLKVAAAAGSSVQLDEADLYASLLRQGVPSDVRRVFARLQTESRDQNKAALDRLANRK